MGNSRLEQMEIVTKREITAINGLKSTFYFYVVILMSNYYQMDLIKKNRWKDIEFVNTSKATWILSSTMYLYIDYMYFFSAFIQAEKLFEYLKSVGKV